MLGVERKRSRPARWCRGRRRCGESRATGEADTEQIVAQSRSRPHARAVSVGAAKRLSAVGNRQAVATGIRMKSTAPATLSPLEAIRNPQCTQNATQSSFIPNTHHCWYISCTSSRTRIGVLYVQVAFSLIIVWREKVDATCSPLLTRVRTQKKTYNRTPNYRNNYAFEIGQSGGSFAQARIRIRQALLSPFSIGSRSIHGEG